jgi:rhomboid protease GluP
VSEKVSTEQSNPGTTQTRSEKQDSPIRIRQAPATFGLIGVTILVYLAQTILFELTRVDLISLYGMKINGAIVDGEIWRLITPVFVHAGLWHIFVNMYSLYALGPAVERLFGTQRMLALYLLSGISGVILSFGFSPYNSVGASGAIFGLLGALGTFIYRHRSRLGRAGRMQLRQIVLVTLLNLGLGLLPMVDNWGHLGGLMAGIALAWTLGPLLEVTLSDDQRPKLVDQRPWQKVRLLTLVAAGFLAVLAFAASFSPFV